MRSRGEKYEIIRTFTAGARQRIGASADEGRIRNPDSDCTAETSSPDF